HTSFSRDWSSDVCSSDLRLEHRVLLAFLDPDRSHDDGAAHGAARLIAHHPPALVRAAAVAEGPGGPGGVAVAPGADLGAVAVGRSEEGRVGERWVSVEEQ